MRILAVVVGVVFGAGCVNGVKQCANDDDCLGGGRCDQSAGICVIAATGGGQGGGTAGGGGSAGGGGGGGGSGGSGGGAGGVGGGGGGGGTTVMCTPACNGWEACRADGGCETLLTGLAFTTPAQDFLTKAASQPFTAAFTPTGLTAYPPNISVAITKPDGGVAPAVMVNGTANAYASMAILSEEGPNRLTASYGALMGARTITFDVTAPSVAMIVASSPADAGCSANVECNDFTAPGTVFFKKDETLFLGALFQTADFDKATVAVKLTGQADAGNTKTFTNTDRVVETNCVGCAPATQCACFKVDLPTVPLAGLNEKYNVEISGARDDAGNVMPVAFTSDAGNPIAVTRVRWRRTLAGAPRSAPAIGRDGTIYVGTGSGIVAVRVDGTDKWPPAATGMSIDSSPAVGAFDGGTEYVFFAGNPTTPQGTLGAIDSATGSVVGTSCLGAASSTTNAGVALAELPLAGQKRLASIGIVNRPGSGSAFLASFFSPAGVDPAQCAQRANPSASNNTVANGGASVVAKGATAYWATSTAQLVGYSFEAGNDNWQSPDAGLAVSLPGVGEPWGLALWSNGTRVAGGGGSFGVGKVFDVAVVGGDGGVNWTFPGVGSQAASGPAVEGGALIYGTHSPSTTIERIVIGAASASTTSLTGEVKSTPVIGAGGEVYVLQLDGVLGVLDATLAKRWSTPGLGGTTNVASLNLDCNRRSSELMQSGPGALYVAASSGHLIAVLVDSPKLSTTAEWPKWQHDAQNSGNPDFPRNAGCP